MIGDLIVTMIIGQLLLTLVKEVSVQAGNFELDPNEHNWQLPGLKWMMWRKERLVLSRSHMLIFGHI